MIPTLLGATLLIFAVTQLFPPMARATLYITSPRQFNPENINEIIAKYGLNDPAYMQFSRWFSEVLKGNLGFSRTGRQPVTEAILTKFPATVELVMYCSPIIVLLGIFLGVKSAVHRDKPIDHLTRGLSIMGSSLPSFWLGIVLLSIFYVGFHVFPPGRLGGVADLYVHSGNFTRYTGINTVDALLNGQPWIFVDAIEHLILPVAVLCTIQIAYIVRVMRSSMLEALNKGFITMARAKGLSQKTVINKHARKNALIPTITLSGILIAGMLNGVIITETVFGFNGVGQWAANSAFNMDIASVLGFTLFSGFLFVVANLLVDILYAYVDPRIRLA